MQVPLDTIDTIEVQARCALRSRPSQCCYTAKLTDCQCPYDGSADRGYLLPPPWPFVAIGGGGLQDDLEGNGANGEKAGKGENEGKGWKLPLGAGACSSFLLAAPGRPAESTLTLRY